MEEIIENIETIEVKSTKYILLSVEEYETLNHQISEAMGFDLGQPTERYAPIGPQLAKINIVYDEEGNETFETSPVMPIISSIQENFPELLIDLTLLDSYTPVQTIEIQ